MINLSKTVLRMSTALLLILLFTACSLFGETAIPDDGVAVDLAEKIRDNRSVLFSSVSEVEEIPSPVCVVVKDRSTYFLEEADFSVTTVPEEAQSVLLVTVSETVDETFSCDISWGNNTGDISVRLSGSITLDNRDELESQLSERFSFVPGEPALLNKIKVYEENLLARNYLTPIEKCKNDYDGSQGVSGISIEQVCDPLVYMTDEDYICAPIGGDIAFPPAERNQYAPSDGTYERPEISGPIGLGFSGLGMRPGEDGRPAYTPENIEAKLEDKNDTFVFMEVIGTKPYGEFTSNDGKETYAALSYNMRFSVITMDGVLLGYDTVSYTAPQSDSFNLNAQMIGITLSEDRYGRAVFQWSHIGAFWNLF